MSDRKGMSLNSFMNMAVVEELERYGFNTPKKETKVRARTAVGKTIAKEKVKRDRTNMKK